MGSIKVRTCALALSLAIAGVARAAAVLETPPVMAKEDHVIWCQLRNVGSTPMTATIEGFGFYDIPVNSSSVTLPPGGAASHLAGNDFFMSSCRFTVSGSKKNVRAIALYWSPAAAAYKLALPAR